MQTLHAMDFGYSEEFLVGEYDLEILSTPRIYLNKVKVNQSTTTNIEIEELGLLNLQMGSPGYGAIYKLSGKDMEFVCTVNESAGQIALVMQPGSYKVVFRYRTINETILTKEKNFTIKSGTSTVVSTKY
jgi:Ca-activated chloride channel family protein